MEQKLWKTNHGGVILQGIWRKKCPGATWKLRRHSPGGTQEVPRTHPGGAQKHPEGTQRHQGAHQEARQVCKVKSTKTIRFYCKNDATDHFRVDGSDVTLTVTAACAQK